MPYWAKSSASGRALQNLNPHASNNFIIQWTSVAAMRSGSSGFAAQVVPG